MSNWANTVPYKAKTAALSTASSRTSIQNIGGHQIRRELDARVSRQERRKVSTSLVLARPAHDKQPVTAESSVTRSVDNVRLPKMTVSIELRAAAILSSVVSAVRSMAASREAVITSAWCFAFALLHQRNFISTRARNDLL